MMSQKAWVVHLQCEKCNRGNRKLIFAVSGTPLRAGCVKCHRNLRVHAERYYVYADFLIIKIREYI